MDNSTTKTSENLAKIVDVCSDISHNCVDVAVVILNTPSCLVIVDGSDCINELRHEVVAPLLINS